MARKVLGYVRVSTVAQAAEGVSLDAQEARIRAFCESEALGPLELLRDAGASAKSLKRPAMERLLGMIEDGQVSAVVAYSVSRLSRSVADLAQLMAHLERKGVTLHILSERIDSGTATGRLQGNIIASVSQWEREVIGERTREGLAQVASTGKLLGGAPFGYRFNAERTRLEGE